MLDLSEAFDDDTTTPATVTRQGGSYVDGYWVKGEPTPFEILASVQPIKSMSQNEWMRLPEGIRNEAEAVVITPFALLSGDRLECASGKFRVLSRDDFQALGGYTRAILGGMKP